MASAGDSLGWVEVEVEAEAAAAAAGVAVAVARTVAGATGGAGSFRSTAASSWSSMVGHCLRRTCPCSFIVGYL